MLAYLISFLVSLGVCSALACLVCVLGYCYWYISTPKPVREKIRELGPVSNKDDLMARPKCVDNDDDTALCAGVKNVLESLRARDPAASILVLSPLGNHGGPYRALVAEGGSKICASSSAGFIDAGPWNLDYLSDKKHLSVAGHAQLAGRLRPIIAHNLGWRGSA